MLIGAGLAALGLLVYFNWADIIKAFRLLTDVKWQILLLIPITQTLSFVGRALYYQSFAKNLGYKIRFKRLLKLAYAVNFVNQISPSVGVTGVTYLSINLRRWLPSGKTTLIEYGRYVISHLAFTPVLILGLGFIYFGGGIDKIIVRIVVLVVGVVLLASLAFLFALTRRRELDKLVYKFQSLINYLARIIRRQDKPLVSDKRVARLLKDFHEGTDLMLKNRQKLKQPFTALVLVNLMEVVTLYVVFLALAHPVNPGSIIISYAMATIAGAISIIPGDFGIYEFAMVATFSSTGVAVAAALSATLIYRVLNKALSLPVGFYFYSRSLGKKAIPKKIGPVIAKVKDLES